MATATKKFTAEERAELLKTISIDESDDYTVFETNPGALVNTNEFKDFLQSAENTITKFSSTKNDILSQERKEEIANKLMMVWEKDIAKFEFIINKMESDANDQDLSWSDVVTRPWIELHKLKQATLAQVSALIKAPVNNETKNLTIQTATKDLFR